MQQHQTDMLCIRLAMENPDLAPFVGLAREVHARFGSEHMTAASLLVAVGPEPAAWLASQLRHYEPSLMKLQTDYVRLRAGLGQLGPSDSQKATRVVFDLAPHPMLVPLFVLEQLWRIDPLGERRSWLAATRSDPQNAVPEPRATVPATEAAPQLRMVPIAAAIARRLGMWQERNDLEDCYLLVDQPKRHAENPQTRGTELSRYMRALVAEGGAVADGVARVRSALSSSLEWTWQWRHLASIHAALDPLPPAVWSRTLRGSGFVTATVAQFADAYAALGQLHERHEPKRDGFRHFAAPGRTGYRAVHTAVDVGGLEIPLRLVVRDSSTPAAPVSLDEITDELRPIASSTALRVLTPTRKEHRLRAGACVLEFALDVHEQLACFVRGATVVRAGQSLLLGPLDPLQSGDVVQILRHEATEYSEFNVLPAGWESKVGDTVVRRMREAARQALQPLRIEAGRCWVHQQLQGTEDFPPRLDQIDDMVDLALRQAVRDSASGRLPLLGAVPSRLWLHRIGIWLAVQSGASAHGVDLGAIGATKANAERILELIGRSRVLVRDLIMPEELRDKYTRRRVCRLCRPRASDPIGYTLEDGELVLHRWAEHRPPHCAKDACKIETVERAAVSQYVVMETSNRVGALFEILGHFRQAQIDIIDVSARRLNPRVGVIRLLLDCNDTRLIDRVVAKIGALDFVWRALGPLERDRDLERDLPPRSNNPLRGLSLENPYVVNEPVRRDERFYGRENELGELFGLAALATPDATGLGSLVFLKGALKFGKTSLAHRFHTAFEAKYAPEARGVYLECLDASWSQCEPRLVAAFAERLPDLKPPQADKVEAWLKHLRGRRVLIVLDEAVRLAKACASDPAETKGFLQFIATCRAMSSCTLVLVGPSAAAESLKSEPLRKALRNDARQVEMQPFLQPETTALLRAAKLGWSRSDLDVPRTVATRVFEVTGGDPYWTGLLADKLWRIASARNGPSLRYTDDDVGPALRHVLQDEAAFLLRRNEVPAPLLPIARDVLLSLAEHGPLPDGQLINAVAGDKPGTAQGDLDFTLQTLRQAGLIARQILPQSEQLTYALSSELCQAYVRAYTRHL